MTGDGDPIFGKEDNEAQPVTSSYPEFGSDLVSQDQQARFLGKQDKDDINNLFTKLFEDDDKNEVVSERQMEEASPQVDKPGFGSKSMYVDSVSLEQISKDFGLPVEPTQPQPEKKAQADMSKSEYILGPAKILEGENQWSDNIFWKMEVRQEKTADELFDSLE